MSLVAPVYKFNPSTERILEFKGYNKKSVIDDGEMREMFNLSSDEYPCLYQRKPRGIFSESYTHPASMLVKDKKLAVISDGKFYYDGTMYPKVEVTDDTQMVAINTRICFFPEKLYFNVKTRESGPLTASAEAADVTVTVTTSTISFPASMGFETLFKADDAVQITASDSRLGISALVQEVTDNAITFPDETFIDVVASGETSTQISVSTIKVARSCPDLDFVMESNNRLWGVSNADNTIYACKLGDPTNWQYYQNTSMDSYYAEQGTDGEWTGCAAYSTHLLFFKEDYIHKVYGSKPSTYQIETAQCHALEKGSSRSIQTINETVFYKSRLGIMAYSGGTPVLISDNFGTDRYTNAVAGTDGIKYYVSAMLGDTPELLVFDMERVLWHKEDHTKVRDFCYHNGKLLYINDNDNVIYEMASDNPIADETNISWQAQLGPFDEYIEDKKIYSKIKMRLKLAELAEADIYIQIDGGEWEWQEHIASDKETSHYVPIVPRRCNRFGIKITGTGYCRIESLVREYRQSTSRKDVR